MASRNSRRSNKRSVQEVVQGGASARPAPDGYLRGGGAAAAARTVADNRDEIKNILEKVAERYIELTAIEPAPSAINLNALIRASGLEADSYKKSLALFDTLMCSLSQICPEGIPASPAARGPVPPQVQGVPGLSERAEGTSGRGLCARPAATLCRWWSWSGVAQARC